MKIPYSALRFPEEDEHIWGLNIFRYIRRYNSNNSWNFINKGISGMLHQEGLLKGIKNIKPPVRLSLNPYAAGYVEFNDESSQPDFIYKGGMDVKYGISESFTLDMMLIPDFGQIQPDDKKLNLSPYELYYAEKRQFFTEGTELFRRGEIFYSRRISAAPKFSGKAPDALLTNEIVNYNPSETQIINATKLSGRTSGGWGMGMLNALTLPSYATLKDTLTNLTRNILVQPFTNYNVTVIDKSLKNNSYVSLINSNMSMVNNPFMANVIATEFQVRDKSKTFAVNGGAGISARGEDDKEKGFYTNIGINKNSGKFRFGASGTINSDKYNPNDLGFLRRNNEIITDVYLLYQTLQPVGEIMEFTTRLYGKNIRIYNPADIYNSEIEIGSSLRFRNNYHFYLNTGYGSRRHDYFETHVKNRFLYEPYQLWFMLNIDTDRRKPLSIGLNYMGFIQPVSGQRSNRIEANFDVRIGQHLQIEYESGLNNRINDLGFIEKTSNEDTIYFAKRNIKTLENGFRVHYALNPRAGINLRVRHYWSAAANKNFYQLQDDGSLKDDLLYFENKDENYNAFNIDLIFRWVFTPGSELSVLWTNSEFESTNIVNYNYWENFNKTLNINRVNSFSIKILYYIDYNYMKRKKIPGQVLMTHKL